MIYLDKEIYKGVKAEADKRFVAPTSAYKSAWIVREYKSQGGRFGQPKDSGSGLLRWFSERWVDINRGGPCGRRSADEKGAYPLCRPTVRVSKQTPLLASEVPKSTIAAANRKKQMVKSKGRVAF